MLKTTAVEGREKPGKTQSSRPALARLVGANREYIEKEIPHISSLLVADLDTAVAHAEVLIVGNAAREFAA